ncbi:MAG: hypothetical protein AABY13_05920, partial [Nanoarchaeota archaeon]
MRKKKPVSMVRVGVLALLGIAVIGGIYVLLGQGCLDGRGTDSYFVKDELQKFPDITTFSLAQVTVVAQYAQSCALGSRTIEKEGVRTRVSKQEFGEWLAAYDRQCGDCLIVHRQGYPFQDALFHRVSGRPLCDQPNGRQ